MEDIATLQFTTVEKEKTDEAPSPQGSPWFPTVFKRSTEDTPKMTSILLTSVNGVYHKESEGVKKETIKKHMKNLSPNCCLLVTEEKTLDLTFKNNRVMSLVTSALKDLIKSTD